MITVLIVDDSAVTRQHLKNILEGDAGIRVIGMAENGEDAVRFVHEKRPDVIAMDINMPKMDGFGATRRIMETYPVPIVIVTASFNRNDVQGSFRAMEAGALAILEKPFGLGNSEYEKAAKDLVQTVKEMSEVKVIKRWSKRGERGAEEKGLTSPPLPRPSALLLPCSPAQISLVVMGASTGGPSVLQTILSGFKREFPVPVLVVQHISAGFLEGMIEWLRQTTALPIHLASDSEHLLPGHIYFAPDNFHMGVKRRNLIELSKAKHENGVRPSVSYLFRSAANVFGGDMAAVLLTGMGKDGAEELKMIRDNGGVTIAQDEESSVVYGMPGEAIKLDAATYVLSPNKIAVAVESLIKKEDKNSNNQIGAKT